LEEIRHAEAIASIRSNAAASTTTTTTGTAPKKPNGIEANFQPHSPLKLRLNPGKNVVKLKNVVKPKNITTY
jgi:hypothetical protein